MFTCATKDSHLKARNAEGTIAVSEWVAASAAVEEAAEETAEAGGAKMVDTAELSRLGRVSGGISLIEGGNTRRVW